MLPSRDDTLLEMRATDAGFELGPDRDGEWLRFNQPGNLATVWLKPADRSTIAAAAPNQVTSEVGTIIGVQPLTHSAPLGSSAAWKCANDVALDALLRRIATLGKILPDQILQGFDAAVATAIERANRATPAERLVETRERVGQDLYRAALMAYWDGRCAITGISEPSMLRASHAKPWAVAADNERLDVHNGLLLAVHLDVAFDKGFIAIADDGEVLVSPALPPRERNVLGVERRLVVERLRSAHIPYLRWHRDQIWRRA